MFYLRSFAYVTYCLTKLILNLAGRHQKHLGSVIPATTMFEAGLLDEKMKTEIEVTAKLSAEE